MATPESGCLATVSKINNFTGPVVASKIHMTSEPLFVLIIDCEDAKDPGSEGRFVKHMLNLMNIPNCYCKAKTCGEFPRHTL